MKIYTYLLTLIVVVFCTTIAFPQQGDYFITHHTPSEKADPSANFDMVQHPNGFITFANRSGLLQFDGYNWENFPSKGTPFSLANDELGVYVAGIFGVGYFPFNGEQEFYLLHQDSVVTDVQQVEVINDKVYAVSADRLYIFSAPEKKLTKKIEIDYGYMQRLLVLDDKPLIVSTEGSYLVNDESLEYNEELSKYNFSFITTSEGGNLLGTVSGELYKKVNGRIEKVDVDHGEYEQILSGVSFTEGIKVNEKYLAIATVNEGILIVNIKENKVERVINQHHGLPDNEVYFLSADSRGGIWTGHAYGLSRIDLMLPYEVYNNFPGIEGNLLTVLADNGSLYVGTSTGLYHLDEIKNYEEIVYYVEKLEQEKDPIGEDRGGSKGLFSFLKRKTSKEETEQQGAEKEQKIIREQRTKKRLSSIKHVYKKDDSINGKVHQLLAADEDIFAISLSGLYKITKGKTSVLSAKPIKHAWINKTKSLLIANTYDGQLLTFEQIAGRWANADHFTGFQDFVMDIYQDSQNRIWFVSTNEVYWIKYLNREIYAGEEIKFKNPYLHPTYIMENEYGEIELKNVSSSWVYDEQDVTFVESKDSRVADKFLKTSSELWQLENGKWSSSLNYENQLLNLHKEIEYIERDETGSIYFITKDNHLLKIRETYDSGFLEHSYPLVVRSIRENGQKINVQGARWYVDKQSELAFEVIQPEFSKVIDIQYQYRIRGMSNSWSEWSEQNNKILLPFLTEGEYTLEVKSRNEFGAEQKLSSVAFEIVPPYWQRPWFYAFEFTTLAVLLFITIQVNHNSSRYRLINKLLAFLTLILIIEFIQVSAESNFSTDFSPVSAFFIQVVIALIVLPVEGLLRRIIMKDKKLKLPMFLNVMRKQ